MSRYCYDKNAIPKIEAAAKWRDECLIRDGSVFSDENLWSKKYIDELITYFVNNPYEGDASYFEKLSTQFEPVSAQTNKLAAEMHWLLFLCPSKMKVNKKKESISLIWSWSGEEINLNHSFFSNDYMDGIGSAGVGYNLNRWREFVYLIKLTSEFKHLPSEEKNALVSDGWAFAEWAESIPDGDNRQFRNMLVFLLFPDEFERIFGGTDRVSVVSHFIGKSAHEVHNMSQLDIDKALLKIRQEFEDKRGTKEFDFYLPDVITEWRPEKKKKPKLDTVVEENKNAVNEPDESNTYSSVRYWIIAPGHGANKWDEFYEKGIVGLGWDAIGDLSQYTDREAIKQILLSTYPDGSENRTNDSLALLQFHKEMKPGDILIPKRGTSEYLGYGVVTSDYYYDDDRDEYKHVRKVEWKANGTWHEDNGPIVLKTLTDITKYSDYVERLKNQIGIDDGKSFVKEPIVSYDKYTIDDALKDVFIGENQLKNIVSRLANKKNVILQGPPGTGKTYIAKRLAYLLFGEKDTSRVSMVQFHQSYSYEDFIQGYRPDGTGFNLKNGIFYKFCKKASNDPDNKYVFIIDEINRANLSKVFGELMMLIESDKRGVEWSIPLTYSDDLDDKFHVPENLHIIGLMNTADRSLAMVDYALRRRFAFVDLEPGFNTNAFRQYLISNGIDKIVVDSLISKMNTINDRISNDVTNLGKGYCIGHSFFCTTAADGITDQAWLKQVIESEIAPLLREYWFDDPSQAESLIEDVLLADI